MPFPLAIAAAEGGADVLVGGAAVEATTAAVGTTAAETTAVAGTEVAETAAAAQRAAALRKAWDLAKALAKAGRITCQQCDTKCQEYACGVPGSTYRGGAHWCMQEPGKVSHHMPPDAVSPLERDFGPAIQMDRSDHYTTPSYGRSTQAPYMQSQGSKATGGDFMGAFNADADAVGNQFKDGKYSAAIAQARLYAQCLKNKGLVK